MTVDRIARQAWPLLPEAKYRWILPAAERVWAAAECPRVSVLTDRSLQCWFSIHARSNYGAFLRTSGLVLPWLDPFAKALGGSSASSGPKRFSRTLGPVSWGSSASLLISSSQVNDIPMFLGIHGGSPVGLHECSASVLLRRALSADARWRPGFRGSSLWSLWAVPLTLLRRTRRSGTAGAARALHGQNPAGLSSIVCAER